MSQPNKRSRSKGSHTQRSATSGSKGGARPSAPKRGSSARSSPVVKAAPIEGESPSFRSRVDRALPPFSVRRYVAIWAVGTALLVGLILVLLFRNNTVARDTVTPSAGAAPTSTLLAGASGTRPVGSAEGGIALAQTVTPDEKPVAAEPTGTTLTGTASASAASTGLTPTVVGTPPASKFMVIETEKGRIVAKLHTEPSANVGKTIANFEKKANAGELNGRVFHRVEGPVVQGGDPTGTGAGGNQMPAEYNELPFKAGALGVARRADPTINNDSQFFFVKSETPLLNGEYTNWGQVVEGMDVLNKIAIGDKMTRVTVETR